MKFEVFMLHILREDRGNFLTPSSSCSNVCIFSITAAFILDPLLRGLIQYSLLHLTLRLKFNKILTSIFVQLTPVSMITIWSKQIKKLAVHLSIVWLKAAIFRPPLEISCALSIFVPTRPALVHLK